MAGPLSERQVALQRIWNTRGQYELVEAMVSLPAARDPALADEILAQAVASEPVNPGVAERLRAIADGIRDVHGALAEFLSIGSMTDLAACYRRYPVCWSAGFPRLVGALLKAADHEGSGSAQRIRNALRQLAAARAGFREFNRIPDLKTYGSISAVCDNVAVLCDSAFHSWIQHRAELARSGDEATALRERLEVLIHACRLRDVMTEIRPGAALRIPHPTELLELWFLFHPALRAALPQLFRGVATRAMSLEQAAEHAARIVRHRTDGAASAELFGRTAAMEYGLRVAGVSDTAYALDIYRVALETARGAGVPDEAFASAVLRYAKAVVRHWGNATPEPISLLEAAAHVLNEVLPRVDPTVSPRLARDLHFTRARLLENLGYWAPERCVEAIRHYRLGLAVTPSAHETEARGSAITDLANTLRKAPRGDRDVNDGGVQRLYEEALTLLPAAQSPTARVLALNNFAIFLNERVTGDPVANQERGVALSNEALQILAADYDYAPLAFDEGFRRELLAGVHLTRGNILRNRRALAREARLRAARESYLQGLGAISQSGHQQLQGILRLNVAHVCALLFEITGVQGFARDAFYSYSEAADQLRSFPIDHAHALIGKATLVLDLGEPDILAGADLSHDIEEAYRAVGLLTDAQHARGLGRARHALGTLCLAKAHLDQSRRGVEAAAQEFQAAAESFRDAGALPDAIRAYRDVADACVYVYRLSAEARWLSKAESTLLVATSLVEELWGQFDSLEWHAAVSESFGDVYAELVWCEAQRSRPVEQIAFHAVRAKSRELLDSIENLPTKLVHAGSTAAYLDALRIEARLSELERWHAERDARPDESISESLTAANEALSEFRRERRMFVVSDTALTAVDLRMRIGKVLSAEPRMAIIDITVSRWGSVGLVWQSSAEGVTSEIVHLDVTSEDLETELLNTGDPEGWAAIYERYLASHDRASVRGEWRSATATLLDFIDRSVLTPLLARLKLPLGETKLLIVAGVLSGLPLHAGGTGKSAGPLYARVDQLGYLPSLALLQGAAAASTLPSRALCVLSDPATTTATQLQEAPKEMARVCTRLSAMGVEVHLFAAVGNERGEEVFRSRGIPLPDRIQVLTDALTRESLRAALPDFDHVFYAGHGQRSSVAGAGLVLTDGVFSIEDALVTPELRLGPFVMLSACETADPYEFLSVEVFSFCACLLRIGARFVVGACWPVSEAAAIAFSEAYYTALEGGASAPKAFQVAVNAVRAQNDDVLSWAPFVLLMVG